MRKVEINTGWQVVDGRVDPLVQARHPNIVQVLSGFVCGPFLLTIQRREAELMDCAIGTSNPDLVSTFEASVP